MRKRALSVGLAVVLALSLVPVSSSAASRLAVTNTRNVSGQDIVNEARKWTGKTYVYNAASWDEHGSYAIAIRTGYTDPVSFDCSGFVSRVLNDVGFRSNGYPGYDCILKTKYGSNYIGTEIEKELIRYGTDVTSALQKAKNGDFSELQPGDLLAWSGHIVIYGGRDSAYDNSPMIVEVYGNGSGGAICTYRRWDYNYAGQYTYAARLTENTAPTPTVYGSLDINGYLDGVISPTTAGYGTFDVYINGTIVADDVTDYASLHSSGSLYEIKDIKANDGYFFDGFYQGTQSGSIQASGATIALSFSKAGGLDVNGYLDGVVSPTTTGYGTFDVYINGTIVADDVTDYAALHSSRVAYEIKDIRPKDGYSFNGIKEGTRTGTLNGDISVLLDFTKIDTSSITATPKEAVFTNGHTYYYYETPVTWYTAKKFCEEHGGFLACITSAEENTFVRWLADTGSNFWTGGTDVGYEGDWHWLTGEAFSYSKWHSGNPNNDPAGPDGEENFLNVYEDGSWNDNSGSKLFGFVCEIIDPESITEKPVEGSFLNNHTYRYYATNVPWNTAKEFCEKQGGYLACITSAEENSFVQFLAGEGAQYWLGGTDAGKEGTWRWVSGENFTYNDWHSGEPNNSSIAGGSENYLHNNVYGNWNDADGNRIMGFVCEFNPCTLTYDPNGGTGAPSSQTIAPGTYVTISTTEPTWDGYTFDGWFTKAEGGDKVTGSIKVDQDTTLYAHWTKNDTPPAPDPDQPLIQPGTVTAFPGQTVSVPVTITNNPGIAGAALTVTYDSSILTLDSIEKGEVFAKGSFTTNKAAGLVQWYYTETNEDITANGTLFTLNFTVNAEAGEGSVPVSVACKDGEPANLSNKDSDPVSVQFAAGAVTVTAGVRGDVTGDNKVLMNDVVKLARSVGGFVTLTAREKALGDVTGDSKVLMNDVVKVARFVAGFITSLEPTASLKGTGEMAAVQVGTVSGRPGQTVQVPVTITGNPGIAGAAFSVDYNADALTLTAIDRGDVLAKGSFSADADKGVIQWYYTDENCNTDAVGTLFTLTFQIKGSAAAGGCPVTVGLLDNEAANLSDIDAEPVAVSFTAGAVQVGKGSGGGGGLSATVVSNGLSVQVAPLPGVTFTGGFCAAYDENGRMLGTVPFAPASETQTLTLSCDGSKAVTVKAFLLDSGSRPVTEALKCQVGQ